MMSYLSMSGMRRRLPRRRLVSWLPSPRSSSGELARCCERAAPTLTGNDDGRRAVAALIDVPKRALQKLRCGAVTAQHSRKQGEEKRTARVLQLVERDGLDAAAEPAVVRAPRQPQETFPCPRADAHSWEVGAHDHNLCPSRRPV